MDLHRTDCITCGTRIYHPSLVWMGSKSITHEIHFFGLRPDRGNIFLHSPSKHYILVTQEGDFHAATCADYWAITNAFEALERIVAGTRHRIAAKPESDPPF